MGSQQVNPAMSQFIGQLVLSLIFVAKNQVTDDTAHLFVSHKTRVEIQRPSCLPGTFQPARMGSREEGYDWVDSRVLRQS
jgi:hypothetical protein